MSQKIKTSVEIDGSLSASQIANATIDTDKFLVSDGGVIKYRTGAELATDLGVSAGTTSKVQHQVKAGVAINKGQAVYVTGADGTNMIVGLASNATEATSSKTMGLLNATVNINDFADVITEGLLDGLDTSSAVAGNPVWLGTGGNLIYGLANKPYAPSHLVFIGIVTRVNANNGEIFVKVQNGFELDEIHDVDLKTTAPINGHLLGFNGTLWVNKTIAGWLGYTPQAQLNGTGFVKASGTTITYDNTSYYPASNPNGYISTYTETDTLASVTGRGSSTSTLSSFNGGLTATKTAKNAYAIQVKGGLYGAPRLQLYDLAVDNNAFVGLGVDMSGAAYEFSNYFPRTGGNGKWSVGSWAGDFGTGQYVSGYNEKLWVNESSAQFNVSLTGTADMRSPIFYDSNDTSYYTNPASTSVLSSVVLRGASAISFYGAGSGTYNIGSIYSSTSINSWEAPLETDSYTAARVPFILTWRGGYAAKGGLKLIGDASAELGGNVVLHSGNISSYAVPQTRTITINGTSYDLSANRSWTVTATETDTLATVTSRGATTSVRPSFDGGITVNGQSYVTANGYFVSGAQGFRWNDSSGSYNNVIMRDNGTTWFRNYLETPDSMRSPIYYDYNNTSYYGDFSSSGTSLSINGGIVTTAPSGSILLHHQVSEGNAWIFRENAPNWGLYWFNTGTQSGQTIGSYTTIGAELFGTNNGVGGFNPNSAWTGTNADTRMTWMLSNYTGYIWSNSTMYAAGDMRSPIYYDANNTGYYVDPASGSNVADFTANQFYVNGWFRNNAANTGLYNQVNGNHIYSRQGKRWAVTGNDGAGSVWLDFYGNHENTYRGSVHADNSNNIGFLANDGGWGIRTVANKNVFIHGNTLYVNADNQSSSNIIMQDSDHGDRQIHCNSNRIGFLNQSGGWGSWCEDNGDFYSAGTSIGIGAVQAPVFYDYNNTGYYWEPATDASHRFQTPSGYIDIGPKNSGTCHIYTDRPSFYFNKDILVNGSTVLNTSNAPRAANSYVMFYEGFTLNANDMSTNSTGFTYSNNAPWTGPVARFSTGGGYDLWLNASYGGNGVGLSYRTRNGDAGSYNSWHRIYSDSYRPYADDSGTTGQRSFNYLYASSYLESGGAVYGTIFYDNNDRAYYVDPNSSSNIRNITVSSLANSTGLTVNHSGSTPSPAAKFNSGGSGNTYGAITATFDSCNYGTAIRVVTGLWSASQGAIQFYSNTTPVGNIQCSTTTTTYSTTSDYRLKENVVPMESSIDRLNALNPCRFNFVNEPTRIVDGFIAHEVQAVIPEAVTGKKDEVDPTGEPVYQGIDQAKIVPLLTAALQEAIEKINSLEQRIIALENN